MTNCTIIAQMIDSVIFGLPVGVCVCRRRLGSLPFLDISEGRQEKKEEGNITVFDRVLTGLL